MRILVAAFAGVCFLGCASKTPVRLQTPHYEHAAANIPMRIAEAREATFLSGLSVGIIEGSRLGIFHSGAAYSDGRPPTDETLYEVGSISKTFTGLLFAKMVVDGRVQIDESLSLFAPPNIEVPLRRPASAVAQAITLEDLVTHHSGLPTAWPTHVGDSADPFADLTIQTLWAGLAQASPGPADYGYNNYAMSLLGHALANRANGDFESVLRLEILQPLALLDVHFELQDDLRERLAQPHTPIGEPTAPWHFNAASPAGGLHMTLPDLLRFGEAQLHPPEALAAAIDLSQRARKDGGEQAFAVAFGWHLLESGRTLFHNGGTYGMSAFLAVDRSRDLVVAVLSNTRSTRAIDSLGLDLLHWLRGEGLREPIYASEGSSNSETNDASSSQESRSTSAQK